jgi:hypothetical protein
MISAPDVVEIFLIIFLAGFRSNGERTWKIAFVGWLFRDDFFKQGALVGRLMGSIYSIEFTKF